MESIIKMVAEKAGIPEAKANIAIQTLVTYLKDKMPAGIGAQVETFIKGKTDPVGIKEKAKEAFVK